MRWWIAQVMGALVAFGAIIGLVAYLVNAAKLASLRGGHRQGYTGYMVYELSAQSE